MLDVRGQLREFARALPGAAEDLPGGERVVKVNGRVFVFLGHDDESGLPGMTVKLIGSRGQCAGARGSRALGLRPRTRGLGERPARSRGGASLDLLRDWIEESYRIVAPKRLVAELDRRSVSRVNS